MIFRNKNSHASIRKLRVYTYNVHGCILSIDFRHQLLLAITIFSLIGRKCLQYSRFAHVLIEPTHEHCRSSHSNQN